MPLASQPTVASLFRYPVKSMLGEQLQECAIGTNGIAGDRAWAVIDEATGKVASAKNPRKWAALLDFRATFVDPPEGGRAVPPVLITCPDGTEIRSDEPGVDAALSTSLGRPVRLAAVAPDDRSFEEVWPDIEGLAPKEFIEQTTIGHEDNGEAVSNLALGMAAPPGTFFDLSVLHLLTTATLGHLEALSPDATFDVRRYRPNILIGGEDDGFVENRWVGTTLRIGPAVEVAVTLPTMRCVMTTLRQQELPTDRTTLQAIAAHNRVEIPGLGTWACAGVYADVATPGEVHLGDVVGVRT